jgi:hypothetical protein
MREVMDYLRASGFKTYIVTGGGQDFVRAYAQRVYGIPPEQVIGSSIETKYEIDNGKPELMRLPKLFFDDDHAGKAIGIDLFIGKRPYAAFGNSTGDREMLEWTGAGEVELDSRGSGGSQKGDHLAPRFQDAIEPADEGYHDTNFGLSVSTIIPPANSSTKTAVDAGR